MLIAVYSQIRLNSLKIRKAFGDDPIESDSMGWSLNMRF